MSPTSEARRLQALSDTALLDTPPEADFDHIVELASRLCGAPISLITLLDDKRQWFKAAKGLSVRETERSVAFCAHALEQNGLFVVPDAAADSRFAQNPLVTGEPHIRFYAGALLHAPEGERLGTLCIIDTVPRALGWEEADTLNKLSIQVSRLIELRQKKSQLAQLEARQAAFEKHLSDLREGYGRLAHLNSMQNRSLSDFLEHALDPVRQTRFTKKELGEIVSKAASHQEQIRAYNDALTLLTELRLHEGPLPSESIPVAELMSTVFASLESEIRRSGNTITPYIPADFQLRHYRRALQFLIQALIGTVLQHLRKTQVQLTAQARGTGMELRISIPEVNLVDNLARFLGDRELKPGIESYTGSPVHLEVSFLREIVGLLGGTLEVQKLGNRGTLVDLQLPAYTDGAS